MAEGEAATAAAEEEEVATRDEAVHRRLPATRQPSLRRRQRDGRDRNRDHGSPSHHDVP